MITTEQAAWLADQIELDQWRTYGITIPDVVAVIGDIRDGKYTDHADGGTT